MLQLNMHARLNLTSIPTRATTWYCLKTELTKGMLLIFLLCQNDLSMNRNTTAIKRTLDDSTKIVHLSWSNFLDSPVLYQIVDGHSSFRVASFPSGAAERLAPENSRPVARSNILLSGPRLVRYLASNFVLVARLCS